MSPFPARLRWLRRALVALGACVVALLLLELGLRTVGYPFPQPRTYPGEHESRPSGHFGADPALGWRMLRGARLMYETEGREHVYLSNERGFRIGETPSTGTRTLAVLGDSFAWGAGVSFDETFAARTAAALGWRVENFGMPGYGIDQIAETLRRCVLKDEPELVLVAIYAWDFQRSLDAYREIEGWSKPAYRLVDGELVERTLADTPTGPLRWLDRHSYAFTASKLASWKLAMRWPHGEWWTLNRAFVERMIDDCKAANVELAFVHVPTMSWNAFPAFGELCAERGVPWLDVAAEVDEPPAGLYYASDKHLNAVGHAWLAEKIVAWLRERPLGD
ncbi:MAG: SGNH/GDSL hydrolase family protein [Planctomycetes bacterium]|nr:SGNH/GDSL hydrolase family protein [Planctomycetota bacterium]